MGTQIDDGNIREGLVCVKSETLDGKPLFYNPPQVFNRDLSLIVLKTFAEWEIQRNEQIPDKSGQDVSRQFVGLNILEMFAATGIRSIRYLKELEGYVNHIYINDLDYNSAKSISINCEMNGIPKDRYRATCADANQVAQFLTPPPDVMDFMTKKERVQRTPCGFLPLKELQEMDHYNRRIERLMDLVSMSPFSNDKTKHRNVIDVIDIDPFSTAAPFLDSAVRCVKSGGLLFVTSTDMSTLCGGHPLISFYRYGGSSIDSRFCHELSLRILLHSIATTAAKYHRFMEPMISCSVDFYVRVFVRITDGKERCKKVADNTGLLLICSQCDSFRILKLGEYSTGKERPASMPSDLQGTCEECHGRVKIGGPFYIGPLHNKPFVEAALKNAQRTKETLPGITQHAKIIGILTAIQEELVDSPLYYIIPRHMMLWKLQSVSPNIIKDCLRKLGYQASHFHRESQSLKTNAPNKVVMDIIRTIAVEQGISNDHQFFRTPILTQGIELNDKTLRDDKRVPIWIPNPTAYWGPKKMHRSSVSSLQKYVEEHSDSENLTSSHR